MNWSDNLWEKPREVGRRALRRDKHRPCTRQRPRRLPVKMKTLHTAKRLGHHMAGQIVNCNDRRRCPPPRQHALGAVVKIEAAALQSARHANVIPKRLLPRRAHRHRLRLANIGERSGAIRKRDELIFGVSRNQSARQFHRVGRRTADGSGHRADRYFHGAAVSSDASPLPA